MLKCKKIFGQFYIISRPHINNQDQTKCYKASQAYLATGSGGSSGEKGKDDKCGVDQGSQSKDLICQKQKEEECRVGKVPLEPTPLECKGEKSGPIYNRNCPRPYVDPCEYAAKPCKTQIASYPCIETPPVYKVPCVMNPDCPYERKSNIGDKIKKILMLVGSVIAAYLLYKNWFLTQKKDQPTLTVVKKKRKCLKSVELIKDPPTSGDIPTEVQYLIIGGGTAAFSAFRAIKSKDPKAKVVVISKDPFYPYMRPPLSKEMFFNDDREMANNLRFKQWNGVEKSLYFEPEAFYLPMKELKESENGGVSIARGWSVKKIDVNRKKVTLEDGKSIKYEKCLLATGGKPKLLPFMKSLKESVKERISTYRGILDFKEIEDIFANCNPANIVIVGGGYMGSELAVALSRRGETQNVRITQVMRGPGPLSKILPPYLSKWVAEKLKNENIHIITNSEVEDVLREEDQVRVILTDDTNLIADQVILAIGVEPNTCFAESAGLEVDKKRGGYVVNAEMLARKDLYVAGDNASFYDPKLGKRRREEHHDHAVVTGRVAGENMTSEVTGKVSHYTHQSMFWSEIGSEIGMEGIGVVDSSLPTVAVFAKSSSGKKEDEYNRGVIFYLKDNVLVGVLLWNLFNKINIARQLLKQKKTYQDLNDVAKLFSIHGGDEANHA